MKSTEYESLLESFDFDRFEDDLPKMSETELDYYKSAIERLHDQISSIKKYNDPKFKRLKALLLSVMDQKMTKTLHGYIKQDNQI